MRRMLLVPALALAVGCGPEPAPKLPPPTTAPPASAPSALVQEQTHPQAPAFDPALFRTAISESLEAYLVARPQWATQRGDHRFDGAWQDISEDGSARVAEDFRARAQGLRTISSAVPATTNAAEADTDRPALDAAVLADVLEAEAFEQLTVRPFERNPSLVLGMIGQGISGLMSHPYAPKHDRLNALDARLEKVPALLKTARARLKAPTRASMQNLAIVAPSLAKSLRDEYTNVDPKDVAGDPALKERLKKNATAAAAAIEAYAAEVAKQFPIATLQNAGIGAESWTTLARLREGVTESPAEVRKLGEAELARLLGELDALLAEEGKKGETRAQFLARLEADTPRADKVLDDYRTANKGVEDWLRGHKFVTVPWERAKLEIVPTPPHMRGMSFASMNAAGPLDAISDARFEVNAPDALTTPERRAGLLRFHAHGALENVSIHEALPGHYLQYLHMRETRSKVRRLFFSATAGEGWAHYCEQAVLEQGYAAPDATRAKAFYLRSALQRAVRVVIDVAENDGSMTTEQAAKFLEENALLAPEAAKMEARRALVWPANMFAYTYGKLSILKLRERVKDKERDKFDLVAFHDRLLSVGSVPVRYIGPAAFGLP